MDFLKKNGKGILLCFLVAFPSWLLVRQVGALEVIGAPVIAIIAGMVLAIAIRDKSSVSGGIAFTSKKILQYAVILLGFGLNLGTIGKVGMTSLPVIISTITTSLVVAILMYRLLKIPGKTAALIGVGSCICGGSAIAAAAPVIDADDEEIAQAISVIFLFNVIAALIFPTLGKVLGLTDTGFGLFAGTAVNDTSSGGGLHLGYAARHERRGIGICDHREADADAGNHTGFADACFCKDAEGKERNAGGREAGQPEKRIPHIHTLFRRRLHHYHCYHLCLHRACPGSRQ